MIHRTFAPALLTLSVGLTLAACGDRDSGKKGADISISDEGGNVVASADGKSGEVAVNVPGFSAKVKLPKIDLTAKDFDLDGVKLYPGSTIGAMNVKGGDTDGEEGRDGGSVQVRFSAPARPEEVRSYFLNSFREKGMKAWPEGTGIAGRNEDDAPFRIDLNPAGGKTDGRIVLFSRE